MENIVLLWKCREPLLADLRSEDVLPYLRQEMVLSQAEEEIITHEITTQGKTLKLLTFLQEKLLNDSSGRPLQALSWALRETYPHLADVLTHEHVTDEDIFDYRKTPSPLGYGPLITTNLLTDEEVVHIVQTELRHHYDHHLQYLTPVPWNEAFQVETSHVFTSLKTVNVAMANWASKSLNEMAKDVHSEGLPMEDIFQPQDGGCAPKHILIEGEPGIGKTTLCRKLAYDWSQNSTQFKTLQNYDLVFHLEARNVETSLMDAIFVHLLPEEFTVKKDQLCKTMEKILIQERTLFIIDAYDELPGPNEDLRKLLHGRKFSRSTVVMTTRPTFANPVIKCFDSGFVILGFPYQRRKEFISKYAAETSLENKLFKSLEDSLFENDTLADLSRNPLYLWFLCLLVEDNRGCLPESRTELFQEVVELLVRKSTTKLGVEFYACLEASEALCVIAFELFLSGKVHIEESELVRIWNEKNKLALQLGLLSKEVSPSRLRPKVMYTFTHKTVQEFLAAKYLCSINDEEMIKCLVSHKGGNLEMILVFLCGLLKGHDSLLKRLYRAVICKNLSRSALNADGINNDKASHSAHHLGLQCLGESGEFAGLQELYHDVVPACFLYHITLCHYCLQGFVTAHSSRIPQHNPDLVLPGMELEMYQMLDYKLLDAVQRCKQMPSIVFSSVLGIHILLEYLTKISSARPDMRHLFIYMTSFMNPEVCDTGYDLRELKSAYTSLMSIETLVFHGSLSRMHKGAESIAQGLQLILELLCSAIGGSQFRMLALVEHSISSSTALVLAQKLCMCRTLTKVFLHGIVVDRLSFDTLLGALATCHNIVCFSVSHCSEEEQSSDFYIPVEVCRVVRNNPLKRLMLQRCCLDLSLLKMLETLLFCNNEIQEFDISYNKLSPEGVDVVQNMLSSTSAMSAIGLSYTGISASGLPGLCQSLRLLSNLQKVDLSGNAIGSTEHFITLCQTLNQLPQLHEVVLNNCGITDSYLTGLILLFHKPTMTHVSLLGNCIGTTQDSARYLVSTLDGTKSLVQLVMTVAHISLDLVRMLTGALSRNSNLKVLHVKGHPCPGAMELMQAEGFNTVREYVRTNIPSVADFSLGFQVTSYDPGLLSGLKHHHWRKECFAME